MINTNKRIEMIILGLLLSAGAAQAQMVEPNAKELIPASSIPELQKSDADYPPFFYHVNLGELKAPVILEGIPGVVSPLIGGTLECDVDDLPEGEACLTIAEDIAAYTVPGAGVVGLDMDTKKPGGSTTAVSLKHGAGLISLAPWSEVPLPAGTTKDQPNGNFFIRGSFEYGAVLEGNNELVGLTMPDFIGSVGVSFKAPDAKASLPSKNELYLRYINISGAGNKALQESVGIAPDPHAGAFYAQANYKLQDLYLSDLGTGVSGGEATVAKGDQVLEMWDIEGVVSQRNTIGMGLHLYPARDFVISEVTSDGDQNGIVITADDALLKEDLANKVLLDNVKLVNAQGIALIVPYPDVINSKESYFMVNESGVADVAVEKCRDTEDDYSPFSFLVVQFGDTAIDESKSGATAECVKFVMSTPETLRK